MSTTYAQRQTTAQKKDASSASSVLDNSSQSESLQRKADMANNAAQRAEAPRPNNTGMPDNLKSGIESLSGFSMDDVRVHYNSSKPATVQALAYTQGTDIHVAPGQEKHLPHEAWHVAQQMAGRVSPTTNINGMPVNDNVGLEHEADVMGEKAVQCKKDDGNVVSKVLQCERNIIQCNRTNLTIVRPGSQPPAATVTNDSGSQPPIAHPSDPATTVGVGGVPQPTAGTPDSVQVKKRLMGDRFLSFLNGSNVPLKPTEVFCAADIDYHLPGTQPCSRHAKNAGSNVGGYAPSYVNRYFCNIGLENLGSLKQGQKNGEKGNPPGACAEPHAVQKALEKIQSDCNLDENGMKSSIIIDDIFISDSVIGVKKEREGLRSISDSDVVDQNKVPIYERCLTCQQWIAPNGHVYPGYLQIIRPTSEGTPATEPNWETYKTDHPGDVFYKILPKPTKGDSDGKIGAPLGNYSENSGTYFHNVDFSSLTRLMDFNGPLNTAISTRNLPLPENYVSSINGRNGLRTVIKKEMLKVMAKQLGLNLDTEIDKIADAEKAQRYYARLDYYRELIGKQGEITGFDEAETDEAETLF
ncbi:MAG: DUF4157 domain-containing protein [Fibrobacter sp.]|nr:DUF4157 domain-containing protein [Fibrobacter sp.]MBQ7081324.1 DUF4157 domain-containing protein [Fibrobacter sp.]